MAVLSIRKLPDEVRNRLRLRAAAAGISLEAHVRAILVEASLARPEPVSAGELQDWAKALYAGRLPRSAVAELLAERRAEREADSDP
jgi:plasmid stability protein